MEYQEEVKTLDIVMHKGCKVVVGPEFKGKTSVDNKFRRGTEGEVWFRYIVIAPIRSWGNQGAAPVSEFTRPEGGGSN